MLFLKYNSTMPAVVVKSNYSFSEPCRLKYFLPELPENRDIDAPYGASELDFQKGYMIIYTSLQGGFW